MRGITEERLRELLNKSDYDITAITDIYAGDFKGTIEILLNECQELNPWQPIETAPKDRRILLFYPEFGMSTGTWISWLGWKSDNYLIPMKVTPTHWQELPEEPKE